MVEEGGGVASSQPTRLLSMAVLVAAPKVLRKVLRSEEHDIFWNTLTETDIVVDLSKKKMSLILLLIERQSRFFCAAI